MYNLIIIVIGVSGLVAQVLVMRELLVSFYGFELAIGLILSNWLICEASGVFLFGRLFERLKNRLVVFVSLQVVFSFAFPLSIYMARTCRAFLHIPFGLAVSFPDMLFSSFLVLIPLSFTHGALFSAAVALKKEEEGIIASVYTLETIGTVFGGLIFTYIFIPYLNSFQIAFSTGLLNLALTYFFIKEKSGLIFKYLLILLSSLFIIASFSQGEINKISIQRQFEGNRVLDYRNSVYGNIAVVKLLDQYTFYSNANPVIVSPSGDRQFIEEFTNLPLLFTDNPKDILLIGDGAGGVINELLNLKVNRIDYAELDPMLIELVKSYPTGITERELNDSRVRVINTDGRKFLNRTANRYDCILVGLSGPGDLSSNRLYTKEFFALANKHLNTNGVLAFTLPGSSSYISKELGSLNAGIFNALKASFNYVHVIPGDYNIYLASDSDISGIGQAQISQRIEARSIKARLLIPGYLNYRLDPEKLVWFKKSLSGLQSSINTDLKPSAVFSAFLLSNKEFFPQLKKITLYFERVNAGWLVLFVLALSFIMFCFTRRSRHKTGITVAYCVGTTGFFSMLMNLILIFCFQTFYGYMYYWLGVFISIFMFGIAAASKGVGLISAKIRNLDKLFVNTELGIAIFTILSALVIPKVTFMPLLGWVIFGILFFLTGFLTGAEFGLASRIFPEAKDRAASISGMLYAADLAGGWLAGVSGGFILLPVIGLLKTCLLIALIKLGSLSLARMNLLTKKAN